MILYKMLQPTSDFVLVFYSDFRILFDFSFLFFFTSKKKNKRLKIKKKGRNKRKKLTRLKFYSFFLRHVKIGIY